MSFITVRRGYVTLVRNGSVFENYYVEYEEMLRKDKGDEVKLYRRNGTKNVAPGQFELQFQCGLYINDLSAKTFISQYGSMVITVLENGSAVGKIKSRKEENSYVII